MTDAKETVELVRKETAFQGYFKVVRYFFRHSLHKGGMSDVISREVFERGQAGAVLLYDPERDEVVLIRQFRAGAYVAGHHPFTWELVAGIIEEGETAEDMIRREVVEEAGLTVGELLPIQNIMLTPGACSEACQIFLGRIDSTEGRRRVRPGLRGRGHPGQGAAVRRGLRHGRAQRGRQRGRRDRPAVARPASRRGAQALA